MSNDIWPEFAPAVGDTEYVVDLKKFGLPNVTLRKLTNFSEILRDDREPNKKLAAHFSKLHEAEVTPLTVSLAQSLARAWVAPLNADGKKPSLDALISMSISEGEAFMDLVNAEPDDENEAKKLASEAKADFFDKEADTSQL